MLRWRANSQAITLPPTNVNGSSTGFGQWHTAKMNPVSSEEVQGGVTSNIIRLFSREFSATC